MTSLKTNIIAQFREPTYEVCGLNCAENRFCVAFNYKEKSEGNEWNCQLTNTTEHKFQNNASKKKRVWTFLKDNVDRSQVVSNYKKLFTKFEDKGYRFSLIPESLYIVLHGWRNRGGERKNYEKGG